jgi:predicted anti-sigma-YlaC factor YlaD
MKTSEHDEIRELLALAAAGALEAEEQGRVDRHVQVCPECATEAEDWEILARGLRRLPTPQPSLGVVERTRMRAEARMAEEAEYRWQRGVLIFLTVFAWVLTILSWPVVRLLSAGLIDLLYPGVTQGWVRFAAIATMIWLAGGAVALLPALNQQRERRAI